MEIYLLGEIFIEGREKKKLKKLSIAMRTPGK